MVLASVCVWQLMQPTLLASACSWVWPESEPWAKPGDTGCQTTNGRAKRPSIAAPTDRRLKLTRTMDPSSIDQPQIEEGVVQLPARRAAARRAARVRLEDGVEPAARHEAGET